MNKIWHYGKQVGVDKVLIQPTDIKSRKEVIYPNCAEDIVDIHVAIAYILKYPHNLQRVSGYKCAKHKKIHKFTFYSRITFFGRMPSIHGFDTPEEVIGFAKNLFKERG